MFSSEVSDISYLIEYNRIEYNRIEYNTIEYNTIEYNTIEYNTIEYNRITAYFCIVRRLNQAKEKLKHLQELVNSVQQVRWNFL